MQETLAQFEAQIPDLLNRFETALRSGYSLTQVLQNLGGDMAEPMAGELKRVLAETQAGSSLQDALDHWLERMPSQDLNLFVATLYVQRELGGNLADKLNFIGHIIRKRKKLA